MAEPGYFLKPWNAVPQPPFQPPQSYNTPLPFLQEMQFQKWVNDNNVPFNPYAQQSDYDMRGFWRALQRGDARATTGMNPNDNQLHYPDFWKTPLHQSFSNESQWAGPGAPQWINDSQQALPSGRIVLDERQPQPGPDLMSIFRDGFR